MKLKFKVQPYQTQAVDSVVDCFAGQPLVLLRFNLVLPSVLETASAPTQRDPDPVH